MLFISLAGVCVVTVIVAFIGGSGLEWTAVFGILAAIVGVSALMLMFLRMTREPDDGEEAGR